MITVLETLRRLTPRLYMAVDITPPGSRSSRCSPRAYREPTEARLRASRVCCRTRGLCRRSDAAVHEPRAGLQAGVWGGPDMVVRFVTNALSVVRAGAPTAGVADIRPSWRRPPASRCRRTRAAPSRSPRRREAPRSSAMRTPSRRLSSRRSTRRRCGKIDSAGSCWTAGRECPGWHGHNLQRTAQLGRSACSSRWPRGRAASRLRGGHGRRTGNRGIPAKFYGFTPEMMIFR